jgi:predicted small secreted protein
MRKLLLGLALASISVLALSACNTVEGAGEDIEDAGEAIQDGADND